MTKFEKWLAEAPAGNEYIYYEGINLPETMRLNPNNRFSDEIRAIRKAYDDGKIMLFQRRASLSRFEYIVRKNARPARIDYQNKFASFDVDYWPEKTLKAA